MVKVKSRYDYAAQDHPEVVFDPKKDKGSISMTNQADKDSADINRIMARYDKTGVLEFGGVMRRPVYGDFTGLGDYHSMLSAIKRADAVFLALPAAVRERFGNDPAKMMDFLNDSANDVEAVKLGLKDEVVLADLGVKDAPAQNAQVEPGNPAPSPAPAGTVA